MEKFRKKENDFYPAYTAPGVKVVEVRIDGLICNSPGSETGEVPPGQEGSFDD